MKIVQFSPDRLELQDGNAAHFVLGMIFICIGVGALLAFLTIQSNPYPIGLVAVGSALLLASRSRKTVFDKAAGMMTLRKEGLFDGRAEQHQLSNMVSVRLKEQIKGPKGVATVTAHHLAIVLRAGEEIPLTATLVQSHVFFGVTQLDIQRKLGQRIATFLNLPFEETKITLARDEVATFADQDVLKIWQ